MEVTVKIKDVLDWAGRATEHWKKEGLATRGKSHNEEAHQNFTHAQRIGRTAGAIMAAEGDKWMGSYNSDATMRLNDEDLRVLLHLDTFHA